MNHLFDEVADGYVVRVGDGRPFKPFLDVFFLLFLKCNFDNALVKLLVAVIDDKLLKAVHFQFLEAVDIQQAQHASLAVLLYL